MDRACLPIVLAMMLAVTACMPRPNAAAAASTVEATVPTSLSERQLDAIRAGVRKELRHPDGARFGEIAGAAKPDGGVIAVCGWVEADFGAQPRRQPFAGVLAGTANVFMPIVLGGHPEGGRSFSSFCQDFGVVM
jgi:hypothetical protein